MTMRRSLLAALCALALAPLGASAQDFPNRPIRMVVPFGPGTTTDIISRVYADATSRFLGQSIVVENNRSEITKWSELVKRSGAQVD